jgi:cytochrome c-type biogenesis protein CcmH/NrfF
VTAGRSTALWLLLLAVAAGTLAVGVFTDGPARTDADRTHAIAETIKCPTCRGQSVADSDAIAARAIRTEIARRVGLGETDDQIRDAVVGGFGDDLLLTPPRRGVGALVWFLPVAGLVLAAGGLALVFRRWRAGDAEVSDADRVLVEQALSEPEPSDHER